MEGFEMKKVVLTLVMVFLFVPLLTLAFEEASSSGKGTSAVPQEQEKEKEEKKPTLRYSEKLVVTAYRLPAEEVELSRVPAPVTVLTAEDIARAKVVSLQELFQECPGVVIFDDVGNGIESTVEWRGFNEGTATTVLVDGVRINEPDDNRVDLEMLPIFSIERVEVFRGSSSTIYGGGAMAGSVNVVTKRGNTRPYTSVELNGGNYSRYGFSASSGGSWGKLNYFIGGARNHASGFRHNGYFGITNLFTKVGYDFSPSSALSFMHSYSRGEFGNPGALMEAEMMANRHQSPFNFVDNNAKRSQLFSLHWDHRPTEELSLRVNLFRRKNRVDTLTTGRMAALFGGFQTLSDIYTRGLTLQIGWDGWWGSRRHSLSGGVELSKNRFGAQGFSTDSAGSNPFLLSRNLTDHQIEGYFLQESLDLSPAVTLTAGARLDRVSFNYQDRLLPSNDNAKRFHKASLRLGVNYRLLPQANIYGSYSQAFLAPTVTDLFAYPGFGSNPDLNPTLADDWEVGLRAGVRDSLAFQLSYYRIEVRDEIVYVFDYFWGGRNENLGRSRREGMELSVQGRFTPHWKGFIHYTLTQATCSSGANEGKLIPMVPKNRLNAGISADLKGKWWLSLNALLAGEQFLFGDEANVQPPLDSYLLLDGRVSYSTGPWEAFLMMRNLLNREFNIRGIFIGGRSFFTPAPGLTFYMGLRFFI
ncbi:hypothetical protein CEE39_06375 [bacterium (candidate division B38) B3_B38]|nr:MAG: hypothetical protein CEE39_06375 [bacterium (candidate division B38) B3_B38]